MKQRLLTDYLHKAAITWQDKVAIQDENGDITYGQLEEKSQALAQRISTSCNTQRAPIAIYLPKGIDCVTAMMGILISGNIYCPLDVDSPLSYIDKMLDTLKNGFIVTDARGEKALLQKKSGLTIIRVDIENHINSVDNQNDAIIKTTQKTQGSIKGTDTALILFTSGSTGNPKGVAISHGRIVDYIDWSANYFNCSEATIIGNQAPFVFTVSSMDIYLCLCAGAKLCIIPKHTLAQSNLLASYLSENKINFIFWVPTAYQNIADNKGLETGLPLYLKQCLFVGEPMSIDTLQYWKEKLPQANFYNLLGATETDMTLCCPVTDKHLQDRVLPLGKPRNNVEVIIINDNGEPVQKGQIGEICILGRALANGYWNDPEKTAKTFEIIANDGRKMYHTGDLGHESDTGDIYFHGRKDHQFKHMGYRIEANGIENTALDSGLIKETCVVYNKEKLEIVMFCSGVQPDFKRQLLRYMMSNLPIYMVPTKIIELEKIPRIASGKKDRVYLAKTLLDKEI